MCCFPAVFSRRNGALPGHLCSASSFPTLSGDLSRGRCPDALSSLSCPCQGSRTGSGGTPVSQLWCCQQVGVDSLLSLWSQNRVARAPDDDLAILTAPLACSRSHWEARGKGSWLSKLWTLAGQGPQTGSSPWEGPNLLCLSRGPGVQARPFGMTGGPAGPRVQQPQGQQGRVPDHGGRLRGCWHPSSFSDLFIAP